MKNFSSDLCQSHFKNNLKQLLLHKNLKQKDLANELGVTAATVSNYLKDTLPSTDFLLRLKYLFPEINLDDILYKRLSFDSTQEESDPVEAPHIQTDIYKYYGLYNLYYLNTATSDLGKHPHMYLNATPDLKRGLLYIYQDPSLGGNKTRCLALFSSTSAEEITAQRDHIMKLAQKRLKNAGRETSDSSDTPDLSYFLRDSQTADIYRNELLEKEDTTYRTYSGIVQMTQNHLYVLLQQSIDFEEPISIILHRKYFRKEHYIGGLGSMCTVSNGHPAEPCLQVIGVSAIDLNISEQSIKKSLHFCTPLEPSSLKDMSVEEEKLRMLAKSLYSPGTGLTTNVMYELSEMDKGILFSSKLNYLLKSNAEKNLLYYSKVSIEDDHNWYKVIIGKNVEREEEV